MGRAFRVVKRTAHLTIGVTERPEPVVATPAAEAKSVKARGRKTAPRPTREKKAAKA
jgi:hypothetical protein